MVSTWTGGGGGFKSNVQDALFYDLALLYILKAKSNFTLFIYIPFQDICK